MRFANVATPSEAHSNRRIKMARIEFKGKPETIYNVDGTVAFQRIKIPELKRSHCDMNAFRSHNKYGAYANSDLFLNLLAKIKRERLGDYVRLDRVPEGVSVVPGPFLFSVSIEV